MGTEKQERHGHGHDQHTERERPASTDVADLVDNEHAAHAASAHQRKHAGKAPPVDERFGEGSKGNVEGRIVRVDIVGGRTRIMIGLGHDQGVRAGMEGYVKAGNNMLADFQIESTTDRVAIATVDVSPESISENHDVVVNPSSKPAPGQDLKGRVVANYIEGDFVKLVIGLGASNGVRVGMSGFMHDGDGKSYKDFVVSQVTGRTCVVLVQLHNLDEVHRNNLVVLNPSSGGGAAKGTGAAHKKHG